jgi:hypothetical protein
LSFLIAIAPEVIADWKKNMATRNAKKVNATKENSQATGFSLSETTGSAGAIAGEQDLTREERVSRMVEQQTRADNQMALQVLLQRRQIEENHRRIFGAAYRL